MFVTVYSCNGATVYGINVIITKYLDTPGSCISSLLCVLMISFPCYRHLEIDTRTKTAKLL